MNGFYRYACILSRNAPASHLLKRMHPISHVRVLCNIILRILLVYPISPLRCNQFRCRACCRAFLAKSSDRRYGKESNLNVNDYAVGP